MNNEPVPFLDLMTTHQELEEELMPVFREAVRSARFIGGPQVEEFEKEFARGLISYSIDDLSRIQGKELDDIERLLGYKHYEEVIRRDDLVIL